MGDSPSWLMSPMSGASEHQARTPPAAILFRSAARSKPSDGSSPSSDSSMSTDCTSFSGCLMRSSEPGERNTVGEGCPVIELSYDESPDIPEGRHYSRHTSGGEHRRGRLLHRASRRTSS